MLSSSGMKCYYMCMQIVSAGSACVDILLAQAQPAYANF